MSDALIRPPKKNPQKRSVVPTLPPATRSRKALYFTVAAAEGRFALQECRNCRKVIYPPRETCPACLTMDPVWKDMPVGGHLISETTVRTSTNVYFRERAPWRIGTVLLDAGPTVLAHIHADVNRGARVRMIARTDKSGKGVMMALPAEDVPNMTDDRQLRELTCDPKFRRVLVTDGRSRSGRALARALADAGASIVFVGVAERWRPFPEEAELASIPNVDIVPLDITDTKSVEECAGEIDRKVDILINNTGHVRPGGIVTDGNFVNAREAMEVNYFGLMRLMQAFGPAMRSRGADGVTNACAWVNLLSIYALSNWPEFGALSASQAAALSLAQCFRAEMAGNGVKVVNAFAGPLEDEWYQPLPPPKVTAKAVAQHIVSGLQQGLEEIVIGDVAVDFWRRWKESPQVLEKELTQIQGL